MNPVIEESHEAVAMEPLLPQTADEELAGLARDIFLEAGKLCTIMPAEATRHAMSELLARIEDYVYREATHIKKHRGERLCRLLRAAVMEGEIARGRVSAIVGLKPSAARQVIRLGLDEELLQSLSPKGPLRIAFPAKVLDSYFPRLFLDLPFGE